MENETKIYAIILNQNTSSPPPPEGVTIPSGTIVNSNLSQNIVQNIVLADSPVPFDNETWIDITNLEIKPGIGWTYENGVFTSNAPVTPPLTMLIPRIITKIAFRKRFTKQELAAIINASKTDAEVQIWFDNLNSAENLDLNDLNFVNDMFELSDKNILTEQRVIELLDLVKLPDSVPESPVPETRFNLPGRGKFSKFAVQPEDRAISG